MRPNPPFNLDVTLTDPWDGFVDCGALPTLPSQRRSMAQGQSSG